MKARQEVSKATSGRKLFGTILHMPKLISCLRNGERISINEALTARDFAKSRRLPAPTFECEECKQRVRAHKASGHGQAHFEHYKYNKQCSQCDHRL